MATLASINGRGVVASRPAAGTTGQMYFATDVGNGVLQRDNGSTYDNQGPIELGYVQVTANQTGISATALTDLTSLTLTITVGSRPIMVEGYIYQFDSGSLAGGISWVTLFDVTGSVEVQRASVDTGDGGGNFANPKIRLAPSAGSRTYKMQARGDGVTTGRMLAASTQPAWLRIWEV